MSLGPRAVVRASLLAAVLGAIALFLAIGVRRVPPPEGRPPPAQGAR